MDHLPDALAPLAAYNQFIIWRLLLVDGVERKVPCHYLTGDKTDAHNPQAWTDLQTAIDAAQAHGGGVGFVFTAGDPFFFLDIDHCKEPSGNWSPLAMQLIGMLPGAAIEVSQSGEGLHIFGTGTVPEHACKNTPLGIELYTEGRFVALTGDRAMGWAATDCSAAMPGLVAQYFPPNAAMTGAAAIWTAEPVPEWQGPEDDAELIAKARKSRSNADKLTGSMGKFEALWTANEEALAELYPPLNDRDPYDRSQADAALAQSLAFWTGKNCDRMWRVMYQSALARPKWDPKNHKHYLQNTILNAVGMQRDVLSGPKPVEPVPVMNTAKGPQVVDGFMYLGATQQIDHFAGCVYVQDQHRVFTPTGAMLKPEQFNATYGGYVFQLESNTSGKTTRKAWEAFTESQVVRYDKAETTCFRPEQPPGVLIEEEGRVMVNTYVPIQTPRKQGDPSPFLDHLRRVLPDVRDQQILLAYMAACIQHKGIKFQWCPLIQGAEGNGKTLFTRCVTFAVGERYTHIPITSEISEKHNEWLFNKIFIGVEDVYVPEHKSEVIEVLKPMITNPRYAMRAMQRSQVMGDNRANFIFNSNHRDGWRKTRNDRRIAVFYTAQQTSDDVIRDGMGGDYFPRLYNWLRADGYAIVADYLERYAIPDELNPATTCHRAPETSSTEEAIGASLGGVEQEILEAIDEQRSGFAGGWISSMALDNLLRDIRKANAIPPNKRRELLQGLGYDWHPALNRGRVNNFVRTDQGKPRLFIKDGHISANIDTPAEVVRAYEAAQAGQAAAAIAGRFGAGN